ncbi:acyl-CoA dehydrogenase family protein [soil metagenome]
MVDFSLTEEQLAFQKTAKDFADKVIRPVAAARDRLPSDDCSPFDLIAQAGELGLTKILRPEEYGGLGLGCMELCIVLEEIAKADIGVATSMILMEAIPTIIVNGASEEQKAKWLPRIYGGDSHVICTAFTEPDRAGSNLLNPMPAADPSQGMKTTAVRDGDEWVINGGKSAWVTNSGPSTQTILLAAKTDPTKSDAEGVSLFYVPADTPGLSFGKQTDKIGLRLTDHAEMYFDDMRVPAENLIGPEGMGMALMLHAVRYSCAALGAVHTGLAQEAFDYALQYAKTRLSWGVPLIYHQAIGMMLADMKIEINNARHTTWFAAWSNDANPHSPMHVEAAMAKIYGTEMAVRVSEKAMNVLGAYGLSKEYPLEKLHRDAISGPIEDIHNIMWRLYVSQGLAVS